MSWFSNGISQYTNIENSSRVRYEDEDHAYGVWFRRSGNSNAASNTGALFGQSEGANYRNLLLVRDSDHASANLIESFVRDASGTSLTLSSTTTVTNGEWYHVVVNKNGNTLELYVDGALEDSGDVSSIVASDPGTVFSLLGYSGSSFLQGYIAEFFKYGRALTTAEITALAGGQRPTELRTAIDDLLCFVPADSDVFQDYHNRLLVTRAGDGVNNTQVYDDIHPPIYDPLPKQNIVRNPTTKAKVEVTGGPYLDIMRHTPYGLQQEGGDWDCFNALNWAIKNSRFPDPANRVGEGGISVPGGPAGCFEPVIGANSSNEPWLYWNYTRTLWCGWGGRGGSLVGQGMGYSQNNSQQGRFSRLRYDPDVSTEYESFRPAIMVCTGRFKMKDFTLTSWIDSQNPTIRQLPLGILFKAFKSADTNPDDGIIDSTTGQYWDANLGFINDALITECHIEDMSINGFDTAIQVGTTAGESNNDYLQFRRLNFKNSDIGLHVFNNQAVDYWIEDIQDAEQCNIYFEEGGNCVIFGSAVIDPNMTYLKIKNSGKNNGTFQLHNIKTDPRTNGASYLVEIEGSGLESRQITINFWGGINQAGHQDSGTQTKFIRIGNNCNVNFFGFRGVGKIDVWGGGDGGVGYSNKIFRPCVALFGSEFTREEFAANPISIFNLEVDGDDIPEFYINGARYMAHTGSVTTHFPQFLYDKSKLRRVGPYLPNG